MGALIPKRMREEDFPGLRAGRGMEARWGSSWFPSQLLGGWGGSACVWGCISPPSCLRHWAQPL